MRSSILIVAVALASAMVPLTASAQDGPTLVPQLDRLFISAGCPQDTVGTCTSTRWLGKVPGDANSNFLTATTPADEVLFRATGAINWRDYASDSTIPAGGYVLDASRDIEVALTVMNNVLMVNETVHARVVLQTGSFTSTVLEAPSQNVLLVNPGASRTFTFAFDIPEELDEVRASALTVEVAVHGVNAQGGYINQSGGSTVKIPHLVEAASG